VAALLVLAGASLPSRAANEIDQLLQTVAAVKVTGEGSAAAQMASDQLARRGPAVLPRLLSAMDTANVLGANWLRTAFDRIVNKELAQPKPQFPLAELREYVQGKKHSGRARRLALELLDRLEPQFGRALLPRLLDDPEFRGDAVELALKAGAAAKAAGNPSAAREAFRDAFRHARESGQVVRAADALKSLGEDADIIAHLGFLTDWYFLGPFDAPGFSGFAKKLPPEEKPGEAIDVAQKFTGQGGKEITWRRHGAADALGQVNLMQAVAAAKEAVAYAYAEVNSPREQRVELRCGADDNCTVWLNGQKILAREQWLNGTRLDRFIAPAQIRKGKNIVLVKICQGPSHRDPGVPNNWSLQLRFCDAEGAGVGLVSALPKPAGR
jgi:hypothetical protein